jgi:hypothetical protein
MLALAVGLLFASPTAAKVQSQALPPGAMDLERVKHNLVAMSVHVRPASAGLKLRGIVADSAGGERTYVFSFFNNLILKSKALPYVVAEDAVEHLVLLDLPPGEYAIRKIDFTSLGDGSANSLVMSHALDRPVRFRVTADKVIYLGRLLLDIGERRVVDVVVRQAPASVAADYEKLEGMVSVGTADAKDEDIALLKQRYPAIAGQMIPHHPMSIDP